MYISYSDIKYYKKFDEVAKDMLNILAKLDKTKSFFISHIDKDTVTILHVNLQNKFRLTEGQSMPLEGSFCQSLYDSGGKPQVIEDTSLHNMAATIDFGIHSYLGVPIILKDNRFFGTLCAVGSEPHNFTVEEIEIITSMSKQLAYLLDLEYLAIHDSLTGLYNFTFLLRNFEKFNGFYFTLLYFDLDRFKYINDTYNHLTGDQILQTVAERLKLLSKPYDIAARFNGDEFVLLIPTNDRDEINQTAEELLEIIAVPFFINDQEFHMTASIGISIYPQDGTTMEELIKNADIAMYRAKEFGKNNFQYFTLEMNESIQRTTVIGQRLPKAIDNEEFVVHYQPQYHLQTNELVGIEALIRWDQGENGMVSPNDFIPVAEETGLILSIGHWVLEKACKDLKLLHKSGYDHVRLAVNVSAKQFLSPYFIHNVQKALDESKIDPSFLELEITENVALTNIERTLFHVRVLQKMGISIAIDDFGTGYSSLSYLKRFPFNKVKLDRSFILEILDNTREQSIVKSIINMAQGLGMSVVAEGVESEEQSILLEKLGCNYGQGFYLGKPMSFKKLKAEIKAKKAMA